MKTLASFVAILTLAGCGNPGGGANVYDVRDPVTANVSMARSSVIGIIDEATESLRSEDGMAMLPDMIDEQMESFEQYATEEGLDNEAYTALKDRWQRLEDAVDSGDDKSKLQEILKELSEMAKKLPEA